MGASVGRFIRFVVRFVSGVALSLVCAVQAEACEYAQVPLSAAEKDRDIANDQYVRRTAIKEYMALIKGVTGSLMAIEWSRWAKLSPQDRDRFAQNVDWEREAWVKTHTGRSPTPKVVKNAYRLWMTNKNNPLYPVGYGHNDAKGSGSCRWYTYWEQASFNIPLIYFTPRQSNGSLVVKSYGYRLPVRSFQLPKFVVLSYQICGDGAGINGRCAVSWWRRWIDG